MMDDGWMDDERREEMRRDEKKRKEHTTTHQHRQSYDALSLYTALICMTPNRLYLHSVIA